MGEVDSAAEIAVGVMMKITIAGAYPPTKPTGWALPAVPAHKAHWAGAASRARPQSPQIGRCQPCGGLFAGGISAPYALKLAG